MSRTENRTNPDITIALSIRDASWINYMFNTIQWGAGDLRNLIFVENALNDLVIQDGTPFDNEYGQFTMPEEKWRWLIKTNDTRMKEGKIPRWAARSVVKIDDEWNQFIKEQKREGTE